MAYLALWYTEAGLGWWILVSALIGLGFTFFSGATEAWLVDALDATGFQGAIETVFGKGQTAMGAATLVGTILGGLLGTVSLGIPYVARSVLLLVVIWAAYKWMHDIGFEPTKADSIREEVSIIIRDSITHGIKNPPIRMFMFGAPFAMGVGIWVFYAFQPYLLELFGDKTAIYLSGIAAAIFAVAQMVGGALVPRMRRFFRSRTSIIIVEIILGSAALAAVGLASLLDEPVGFWVAIVLLAFTALVWAISGPMQQAYMNEVIPSQQRATVLSFASLMGSAGGVVIQPALGRVADVYSLGTGYVVAGVLYAIRLPFIVAVKRMGLDADEVARTEATEAL
jgi:MFS family permease